MPNVCAAFLPCMAELSDTILWFFGHLLVALLTFLAVRLFDWVKTLTVSHARVASRDVACQTQTTYTEVRGAARARFQVLAEHSHG